MILLHKYDNRNHHTYLRVIISPWAFYTASCIKVIMKKLLILFFALLASPSFAAEPSIFVSQSVIDKNKYTIQRIEQYLTRLGTIVSEFTQVAPNGTLASGKFYLQRPGKMRWQYNPPTPVLMVSSGTELIFYDYELNQVSHIPLAGSLISFLAQEKIIFGGDVGITKFSNEASAIRIEVAQRAKPTEGKLMLEFSDSPLTLRSMVVTDSGGQVTTVALQNAQFGAKIDPKLFVFIPPSTAPRRK